MLNKLETFFWKLAVYLIKRGYGANCKDRDLDGLEFGSIEEYKLHLNSYGRCPSCRAKEIIEWIEDHIKLINY